ncbi:sarcosine oxidase subunit gamma [Pseudooceanicola algae]|uniref:GCVT N-terminal domain-containing protein n=1 Tax=Pseudooceanicola algae TaxID=1537215 RepID=A0A418SFE2_9RHOB|nr:sarcosine oxidase subunit gamma [Pseudooceanicola algae]QPM89194.1 hypothetical protein PSAL_004070 [Pseudooceanicola algae]
MADPLILSAQNALPQGEAARLAGTAITVLPMARLTSLMAGRQVGDLAEALQRVYGLALPESGRSARNGTAEIKWFGHRHYLLIGADPAPLAQLAAMTDQSDAWATVLIEGPKARDVLARLCPLDLRAARFVPGATARSEIRHMMASVTRVSEDGFRLMVFRSMGQTLLSELRATLTMVAARPSA